MFFRDLSLVLAADFLVIPSGGGAWFDRKTIKWSGIDVPSSIAWALAAVGVDKLDMAVEAKRGSSCSWGEGGMGRRMWRGDRRG